MVKIGDFFLKVAWAIVSWPRGLFSDPGTILILAMMTFPVTGMVAMIPFLIGAVLIHLSGEGRETKEEP